MLSKLYKRNYIAAFAHLASAGGVLLLYNYYKASQTRSSFRTFRYEIAGPNDDACTTGTPGQQPTQCNVEAAFTKPTPVVDINIIYGCLAFFVFTATAHLWYATDALGSGLYSKAITAGWNPYRWFEYATSAGIMSILIGLVDGTRDISVLFALFGITVAMMFNGFVTESLLKGRGPVSKDAQTAIIGAGFSGWTLFMTLWTILLVTFGVLVRDVNRIFKGQVDPDGNPIRVPTWIWIVVIMQAIYYALFGLVQFIHIRKRLSGKAFNYESIENMYITLSYVAKLSLAGGISYGLIWRVKDCPE
jgi:hypothetical protein